MLPRGTSHPQAVGKSASATNNQKSKDAAPQQEPSHNDGAPRSIAAIKPSKMSSYMNFEGNLTVESDKCAYTEDAIISDYT